MAGLLASLLGGCAGGESQAKAADEKFLTVDHVSAAHTIVSRPGSPLNVQYTTTVTLEESLTAELQAHAIDGILLVARDDLSGTANYGYVINVSGGGLTIDMEAVVDLIGAVGNQQPNNLRVGQLWVAQDDLKAYVSPSEGS